MVQERLAHEKRLPAWVMALSFGVKLGGQALADYCVLLNNPTSSRVEKSLKQFINSVVKRCWFPRTRTGFRNLRNFRFMYAFLVRESDYTLQKADNTPLWLINRRKNRYGPTFCDPVGGGHPIVSLCIVFVHRASTRVVFLQRRSLLVYPFLDAELYAIGEEVPDGGQAAGPASAHSRM